MKNHVPKRLRMLVAAVGAVLLGTLFLSPAATAGDRTTAGPTTWRVHVGTQSRNGAVQGMQFLPGDIWIDVGDTVRWTAASMEPHTVTFLPLGQLPGPFDPGNPAQTTQSANHRIGQVRIRGVRR